VTARTHGGGVLLISNIEIPLPSSSSSLEKATVDDLLTYTKDVKVEELERPLLVTIFAEEALCTEEADFAAWVTIFIFFSNCNLNSFCVGHCGGRAKYNQGHSDFSKGHVSAATETGSL